MSAVIIAIAVAVAAYLLAPLVRVRQPRGRSTSLTADASGGPLRRRAQSSRRGDP